MLSTIIVDDEKPSLDELSYHLRSYEDICIVGAYTGALKALDAIQKEQPDVVFLDISMPKMSGLEMADMLLASHPDMQVVFVTAFNHYAVEAFELNAIDYILKPVNPERLDKTVRRLGAHLAPVQAEAQSTVQILCMNNFEVLSEGQRIKWRTKKCGELLAFLLQHKNKELSADYIIDALWQDTDENSAKNMLYTTVYSLRKSLTTVSRKDIGIIKNNGCYILKSECETDAEQIERLTGVKGQADGTAVQALQKVQALYTGDYLNSFDTIWAEQRRTYLRNRYFDFSYPICEYLFQTGDYGTLVPILEKSLEIDRYDEKSHLLLLKALDADRDNMRLKKAYDSYCRMMTDDLGLRPTGLNEIIKT